MAEDIFDNTNSIDVVTIEIDVAESAMSELVTEVKSLGDEMPIPIVEESVPFEVVVDEFAGASVSTNIVTNHTSSGPNQHTIGAITGLQEELDNIKRLQTVYSNDKYHANYFMWQQDSIPANAIGVFVKVCEKEDKITICQSTDDVFGVTVPCAAFIGGQDDVARDGNYGLVINSGIAYVQCESDVAVGDYVVPNDRGEAKKSGGNHGYLVTGLSELNGIACAVISLTPSTTLAHRVSDSVKDLEGRMDTAEQNITSVGNVANTAYTLAKDAKENAEINSETLEKAITDVIGRMDKIDGENGIIDDLSQSINNACENAERAKQIAGDAVTAAQQIGDDAYASANEAIAAIKDIGAGSTVWAKRIDAYSVGEYSQAYGLTWEQAKAALSEGLVYIPTQNGMETYVGIDNVYEQEFFKGYYYTWNGEQWDVSSTMAVNFSSVYINGSEQAPYWVVTDADVENNGVVYKLDYLYKLENGAWDTTGISATENTLTRAVSAMHQAANEISMQVTNVKGDVVAITARVGDAETSITTMTEWKSTVEEDVSKISTIEQITNDNESSIALVVAEVDGEKVINSASIVTSIVDDESSIALLADNITLDADNITFTAEHYQTIADNITLDADQITFTAEDYQTIADNITLDADNINFEGSEFIADMKNEISMSVSESIEIGGRNLLLGTATPITLEAASDNKYKYHRFDPTVPLKHGQTYSFGADVTVHRFVKGCKIAIGIFYDSLTGSSDLAVLDIVGDFDPNDLTYPYSGHISGTITVDKVEEPACLLIYAGVNGETDSNKVEFSNIKFEEGSVPTSWTPAPEDMVPSENSGNNCSWSMNTDKFKIEAKAAGKEGGITVDADGLTVDGIINAQAGGTIGGWDINANSLTSTDKTVGLFPQPANNTDCIIWAGNSEQTLAPFQVLKDGTVKIHKGALQITEDGQFVDTLFTDSYDYHYNNIDHENFKYYRYSGTFKGIEGLIGTGYIHRQYAEIGASVTDLINYPDPNARSTLGIAIADSYKHTSSLVNSYTKFTQINPGVVYIGAYERAFELDDRGNLTSTKLSLDGITSTSNKFTITANKFAISSDETTITSSDKFEVTSNEIAIEATSGQLKGDWTVGNDSKVADMLTLGNYATLLNPGDGTSIDFPKGTTNWGTSHPKLLTGMVYITAGKSVTLTVTDCVSQVLSAMVAEHAIVSTAVANNYKVEWSGKTVTVHNKGTSAQRFVVWVLYV